MPACVTFDPGTQLLSAAKYDTTLFDSSLGMQFLDPKKLTAVFILLQNQQQLLTPPSSPEPLKRSPFDDVPYEILDQILGLVHDDIGLRIYEFHAVAINWLYRHVPIADPYAFTKFLTQIRQHPEKGMLVRTLDFSPFSVVFLGRSANDNKQIKMVCPETLAECFNLLPNLQELLLSECLDSDLDLNVLNLIFNPEKLPKLEAVDFCGISQSTFAQAFEEMLLSHIDPITGDLLRPFPPIKRLSLHGCLTLPSNIYPRLLNALPQLTHLDLSSTQINSCGLQSISPQSRLRHLYLGNCGAISGRALLSFLLDHPASTHLESLNIRVNDELNHPITPRDVPIFLSALKSKGTLRMLDVCGMPINDENTLDFPTTLVELGLHRTGITPQGILMLLSNIPELFYLDIDANLSGGKLRLSQYADVFTSIRHNHQQVRIVECSGPGVETTDEIHDILYGWHWLHGRSRRGWLISKNEHEELVKANPNVVKIGWNPNKLNCCSTHKYLHGHYWYYAFGRDQKGWTEMTTSGTTKPHIQEHFQQIIWYSLDNNLVNNALFVAERLLALNDRDPNSRHLLGLCMLRAGRASSAYNITIHYRHLGCSYVFAQSCKELGKYREGLLALQHCLTLLPNKWTAYDHSNSARNNLPDIGAVLCLMGHMQRASGDSKRAMDTYIEALKANPYLWEAFDGLIELGVSLRVENCFKASSTMRALRESTHTTNIDSTVLPPNGLGFPSAEIPEPSRATSNSTFQPIFNWSKSQPTFSGRFNHPFTPGTPTMQGINSGSLLSEESPIVSTTLEIMKPVQRLPSRSVVDTLKGKAGLRSVHETTQKKPVSSSSGAQNTRRSERLLSTNTRIYGKTTTSTQGSKRSTRVVNSDNLKKTVSLESSQPLEEERNSADAALNMSFEEREEAESQLLGLYTKIGEGCYALSRYDCLRALAIFKSLPTPQSNSPYVLSRTARALYESRNLSEAYKQFILLRQVDPGRLEDMELFSTVLFHLSKEVDLAFLAHELVDLDWLAPQTWCVVGNSFASQHEHDQAIACFQRAIQLDPRFAYAYSLQGLEHTENEEYDKARQCFMNALRANRRLYHAWYGLGSVEFKSGKNQAATKCFKAASNLNPSNSIIMCCIGNCLERAGDFHGAMEEYKRAADISPTNISARYQLARMYIHLKHFDAAERELVRLKDASPDNAKPYFMLGRIYKAKGERAKALHNFTTALSLDPKASHIIKDQIENLDQPAEELYGGEGEVYNMDRDDV